MGGDGKRHRIFKLTVLLGVPSDFWVARPRLGKGS